MGINRKIMLICLFLECDVLETFSRLWMSSRVDLDVLQVELDTMLNQLECSAGIISLLTYSTENLQLVSTI